MSGAGSAMSQAPVVIVGGGIAGCATAYYLALRSIPSIVVEQSCVAAAASGKAGGFLARGWGNGSSTQLHERGYDLHVELAATLGIASYRRLETAQAEVGGRARGGGQTLCPWLDGKVQVEEMDSDTAQVTPLELTTALLDAAVASGFATLRIAKCVGVRRAGGDSGAVVGIDLESGDSLACAQLVVAAGPWSCLLDDWLGIPRACPMEGIWSSSCVWEQQTAEVEAVAVSAPTAVFCGEDANHCHLELYPRPATEALPRGSIYACGFGSSEHMQLADMRAGGKAATAQMVVADEKRVAAASKTFATIAPSLKLGAATKIQACMRPCLPDALPALGAYDESSVSGLFVATGGNCWGILWGPLIGKSLAQLLAEGKCDQELGPFRPSRFVR